MLGGLINLEMKMSYIRGISDYVDTSKMGRVPKGLRDRFHSWRQSSAFINLSSSPVNRKATGS